jgi:anti-sigma B factor antagonist
MKIGYEEKGDVVIVNLEGKIMGGDDATMFHGHMHEFVDAGKRKVVVNLTKVDWMNSVGLGMLITGLTTMKNCQGELKLANVTDNIQSLLAITRLVTIFDTYDSVDDAINAF